MNTLVTPGKYFSDMYIFVTIHGACIRILDSLQNRLHYFVIFLTKNWWNWFSTCTSHKDTHSHTHTHLHTQTQIQTHTHTHIHTDKHSHTHTHTHARTLMRAHTPDHILTAEHENVLSRHDAIHTSIQRAHTRILCQLKCKCARASVWLVWLLAYMSRDWSDHWCSSQNPPQEFPATVKGILRSVSSAYWHWMLIEC